MCREDDTSNAPILARSETQTSLKIMQHMALLEQNMVVESYKKIYVDTKCKLKFNNY